MTDAAQSGLGSASLLWAKHAQRGGHRGLPPASGGALCGLLWDRSKVEPTRCYPWNKHRWGLCSLLGGSRRAQLLQGVQKRRAAPSSFTHHAWWVPHCACPRGSQKEANSLEICCAKWSSSCTFFPKTPFLVCGTSLAHAVPREARQKSGICSAGPHQSSASASFFCHPFPKAWH